MKYISLLILLITSAYSYAKIDKGISVDEYLSFVGVLKTTKFSDAPYIIRELDKNETIKEFIENGYMPEGGDYRLRINRAMTDMYGDETLRDLLNKEVEIKATTKIYFRKKGNKEWYDIKVTDIESVELK